MKLLDFLSGALLLQRAVASFYDNPEQDPPPAGGTPLEELQKKWDFEVRCAASEWKKPA